MALLALASSAFQVYAQSNMTVSGKIEGIPSGQLVLVAQVGENQVDTLEENAKYFGLTYYGLQHPKNGIIHVVGPVSYTHLTLPTIA